MTKDRQTSLTGKLETGTLRAGKLKKRAEFLHVAAKGRKAAAKGVVVQALARPEADGVRLGFTVTKKVGNAVVRNRTRRRLREAVKLYLADHALPPADLVLIGRDSTRKRRFDLLIGDIGTALERSGFEIGKVE